MKKIFFTGIRPTGKIHIGHYLGLIKWLEKFQLEGDVILMIADLHAQSTPFSPNLLKKNTLTLLRSLIALGIDPKKTIIFQQSKVPAHLYLYWILGTLAPLGDLMRMHQFKEFSQRYEKQGIYSSILMYPVLQAADVLLYQPDIVPVGKDQLQHLELTRELARRFNKRFGNIFKIPDVFVYPETEKIMSLDNPQKKMSKSLPEGALFIFDSLKNIKLKIQKAVTDSETVIRYDPERKPGISNLMTIYKHLTQKTYSEIENEFSGLGYALFKERLIETFWNYFKKARQKYNQLKDEELIKILEKGNKIANKLSQPTLDKVLKLTGLK